MRPGGEEQEAVPCQRGCDITKAWVAASESHLRLDNILWIKLDVDCSQQFV